MARSARPFISKMCMNRKIHWERCLSFSKYILLSDQKMANNILKQLIYNQPFNLVLLNEFARQAQVNRGDNGAYCQYKNLYSHLYKKEIIDPLCGKIKNEGNEVVILKEFESFYRANQIQINPYYKKLFVY